MSKRTAIAKTLMGLSAVLLLSACANKPMEMPPEMMAAAAMAAPPAPMAAPAQRPPAAAPAPGPVQAGPLPGSRQDFEVNVGNQILFAFDRSDIDDRARTTLQKQAAWLQRYPAVVLTIEGHADERGTREYNLALGARRAQAVKDYLASLGVSNARLETISYGKERPVCVQSDESCWAQNRRGLSAIKSGAVS
jgi:peptidoglycan-associated lipoprotein